MTEFHVTVVDWIAIGFFALLTIVSSTQIGKIWRGEQSVGSGWFERTVPMAFLIGWTMLVQLALVLVVLPKQHPPPVLGFLVVYGFLLLLIEFALWLSVAATGHPEFAVAPHLRKRPVTAQKDRRRPG